MRHFRVVFRPDGQEIAVHEGASLLEAARQAGIILTTPCGGEGTCGKCVVLLQSSDGRVLACQYRIESDLVVVVPPESRLYAHKILDHGLAGSGDVRPTTFERYRKTAGAGGIHGVAIDIGTTTVVAKLLDMTAGRPLATRSTLNPQTRYGDDVVSRITYGQSDDHLAELRSVIRDCVNELIGALCRGTGLDVSAVYEVCIVGNTTMNHLFLGFPVEQLGRAPYRPHSVDAHDIRPGDLGMKVNPAGNVHVVENIAGFVGADTTAVAVAVDMDRIQDRTLVVDIGTNGELILGAHGKLYAASCAAGPALEGARIQDGSRAAEGAIEAVSFVDDELALDIIGDAPARSICGSGLIDAVAVMLDLGVVDQTGRFTSPEKLPQEIASRLIDSDGQPAFCLASETNSSRPRVVLTQKDVREVQLAKAAIRVGIHILLDRVGMSDGEIDRVLLAGAFGNYIRPRSAVRIGLLPDVPLDRIQSVGNAAAVGAEMLLISDTCRERAAELARRIEYVEIAHTTDFADTFADAMFLNP